MNVNIKNISLTSIKLNEIIDRIKHKKLASNSL